MESKNIGPQHQSGGYQPEAIAQQAFEQAAEEVNEDGVILSSAAEGEENDRYMVTKEELGLDEVNVGEQLKIEWDGVIKTSDPAQFGQIIKAEKKSISDVYIFIFDYITKKRYNQERF